MADLRYGYELITKPYSIGGNVEIQTPARVELGLEGNCVVGWIHSYDPALGLVCIDLEDLDSPTPDIDQELRMTLPNQSTVQSTVLELEGDRWILSLPVALSPEKQRKHFRHLANGAWFFDIPSNSMELYDVSSEGIGLLIGPQHPFVHAGWKQQGTLRYLGTDSWKIEVVATNLRSDPYHEGWSILGCHVTILEGSSERFEVCIVSQV